jgi:hypothetical protein
VVLPLFGRGVLAPRERVGLLPEDDRWFTIYFAQLTLCPIPLPERTRKCQVCARSKLLGIPSAAHD